MWAACPVVMDAYGIVKIWSFRDDILVLASERFTSNANGRGLIQRASYFITKCAAKANTRFLKDSRSTGTLSTKSTIHRSRCTTTCKVMCSRSKRCPDHSTAAHECFRVVLLSVSVLLHRCKQDMRPDRVCILLTASKEPSEARETNQHRMECASLSLVLNLLTVQQRGSMNFDLLCIPVC